MALEPEEQLLSIAERQQDPVLLVAAILLWARIYGGQVVSLLPAHIWNKDMHSHDLQSQKSDVVVVWSRSRDVSV